MSSAAIIVADRWQIEDYETVAEEFFRAVLDLDYAECLVTDESNLSDFSSCGMPETAAAEALTLDELYAAWDVWVIPVIYRQYGLSIDDTNILLVELFDQILAGRYAQLH